jgi:hypothetical protein
MWKFFSHATMITEVEGVWEQDVEKNINLALAVSVEQWQEVEYNNIMRNFMLFTKLY